MACVVVFLFWQLQDVATWAWNTLCLQGFLLSLLTHVIQVFGAWRNERGERVKIFRSKHATVERKGSIFRGKKMVEAQSMELTDFHAQRHLSPTPDISPTSHKSTQHSERKKERAGWLSISRKSWVSFIIYKFHFVHIFRDIKRLVVMQFVLSINANPQR